MELSSFLKKLKGKQEQEPRLFLAVQIDDEFVKTAIWTVKQETTSLVAVGSTQDWDGSSTEILIEAVDASLAVALEKLTPQTPEPNQIIFGLPETWVGTDGISPPRLKDLKQICQKLELDPVGFVVTTEAITHYLKSKEGTPLSAILARISTTEVTVSITRLGNVEGTHVVGRSGDLAGDVREGLTRFGDQESLPARMIIYDGGEDSMEDLTQQLTVFDWQSYLPFLHMPHIEAVPEIFSITAIAVAGGSEVAKSLGFTITHISPPESEPKPESKSEPESEKEKTETIEPEPELKAEPETAVDAQPVTPPLAEEISASPRWPSSSSVSPVLTLLKKTINRIISLVPRRFPIRHFPFGVSKLTVIATVIIFLVVFGTITAAKRLPKATLRLTFQSQTLNHKARVTVDPSAQEVNPDNAVLPASPITITKSGQKTADTTGKKTVGDKAKGEVTIYNRRTDGGKTFAAGTVIFAANKEFTLDSEVQVASASAGADYSIVPGKALSKVTARDFGPESNLAADSEFQINTFSKSTYIAKNDSGLTGGTKRDIQVASTKDLSNIKKSLLDELKSQAANDIESESADRQVFPDTLTATAEEEKYSAVAGEETESVKLELTAKVTALAVEKQNLQNLLSALLRDAIPSGFTLSLEDLKVDIENVDSDGQTVSFDAIVTAKLSPIVDRTEIVKMILGKRPQAALNQVEGLPHFRGADLQILPKFPSFLQWFPGDEKRLNLEIKLED